MDATNPQPRRLADHKWALKRLTKAYLATQAGALKEDTIRARTLIFRKLERFTGVRIISIALLADYSAWLSERFSAGTAQHHWTVVKGFIKWLYLTGEIDRNYCEFVKAPQGRPQKPRLPFTREALEACLRVIKHGPHYKHILIVGWHTGLAVRDAARLRWRDIDMHNGWVRGRRIKTDVEYRIPFDQEGELERTFQWCAEFYNAPGSPPAPDDFVCPPLASMARHHSRISFNLRRIFDRAGVPRGMTFHGLRARFCSDLVNSGANPVVAVQITGHRSLGMLQRYATVSDDAVRRVYEMARGQNLEDQFKGVTVPINRDNIA